MTLPVFHLPEFCCTNGGAYAWWFPSFALGFLLGVLGLLALLVVSRLLRAIWYRYACCSKVRA